MGDFVTDNQYVVFDGSGVKASLQQLIKRPGAWVWHTPTVNEDTDEIKERFRAVPWLWRGTYLRADAVASMPFQIMRGETVVDDSTEWQNQLGFLPHPESLLWMVEAGLTLLPEAYLYRDGVGRVTTDLRYLLADSITPEIEPALGLTGFKRRVGSTEITLPVEEVVYFWRPDPFTEYGPADNSSPAKAALAAAGVLYNVDEFAAQFFRRGAVRAQLLKVPANTPAAERKRAEAWWRKVFSGIGNAWATKAVSEGTEVETIGEGIAELSNSGLTAEKREDIATALGIPMTLLWSTEAGGLGGGGVVTQDERHFYSKTTVPECQFIARVLNAQLFEELGLRWEFRPETLDVFQVDENKRATSFGIYVDKGITLSVAAQMCGLELPEGVEPDDLDAMKEEHDQQSFERQQQLMEAFGGRPQDANQKAMRADLRKWRTKARKAGGAVSFESDYIPAALKSAIEGSIAELGVDAAFEFLSVKKKSHPAGAR